MSETSVKVNVNYKVDALVHFIVRVCVSARSPYSSAASVRIELAHLTLRPAMSDVEHHSAENPLAGELHAPVSRVDDWTH